MGYRKLTSRQLLSPTFHLCKLTLGNRNQITHNAFARQGLGLLFKLLVLIIVERNVHTFIFAVYGQSLWSMFIQEMFEPCVSMQHQV